MKTRRHNGNDGCDLELFARCAAGFEAVLARELKGLGLRRVRPLKGGVALFGNLADAYRACLWSRVATRVQLVLARLDARDADALYAGVVRLPWERHVPAGATISVQAHGTNPSLRNTQFTALKVKDALCDRLRQVRGERPGVDAHDPDLSVDVSLHKSHATLYLNLSGPSLHRRGYREQGVQTEAPLKETLAAGMLLAAGWETLAHAGAALADPLCGSGTLAIEAALIAADVAPGILRTRWGFEGWAQHDERTWEELTAEARRRAEAGRARCGNAILAGDLDPRAVEIARSNASRAGVADLIRLEVADASTLQARLEASCGAMPPLGLVATNPPYGLRLQDASQLPETYAALAAGIGGLPDGWRLVAITPDAGIDTALGMAASQTLPCFNGPIEASVRLYDAIAVNAREVSLVSLAGTQRSVAVAERTSEQFASRLRKVAKERAKWARRAAVSCYRIYDADLPDYAVSVDLFVDASTGARHVRVEERPAPATIDADRAARRLADALALVSAVLDVDRGNVVVPGGDAHIVYAQESGLSFEVNLAAKRDTGMPLDLRPVRELLRERAQGARFLSLGSYAGVPAAVAAAGGATGTTTVDSASSYLDWARRNLEANGHTGRCHRLERSVPPKASYDLVYADVAALTDERLAGLSALLGDQGTLVLVGGSRAETPDIPGLVAREVTPQTIPHDFGRTPKVHRCWLICRER